MASLILLLMVSVASQATPDRPQRQTPGEQLQALFEQYREPPSVYLRSPEKARAACQSFLKLAGDHPDDPAAVEALRWVVTHTFVPADAGQAMALLARDHSRDGRLGPICRSLDRLYGDTFKPLADLFRAVLKNSPSHEAQGVACLALARRLEKDRQIVECARLQNVAETQGRAVPHVPVPTHTDADLERMSKESASLYQRVIDQYGDLQDEGRSLAEIARVERSLSGGNVAPEIEGEDLDGKRFKLSDYRGKVVVLSFWNHAHCGACRASYPEERELVKRMEGKPFVFLGINVGDEPEVLRTLRSTGEVTWKFWVDGDFSEAKITKAWNVHGWPTVFVLDRDGVIRHQGFWMAQVPLIEFAAERLLKDVAPTEKP